MNGICSSEHILSVSITIGWFEYYQKYMFFLLIDFFEASVIRHDYFRNDFIPDISSIHWYAELHFHNSFVYTYIQWYQQNSDLYPVQNYFFYCHCEGTLVECISMSTGISGNSNLEFQIKKALKNERKFHTEKKTKLTSVFDMFVAVKW